MNTYFKCLITYLIFLIKDLNIQFKFGEEGIEYKVWLLANLTFANVQNFLFSYTDSKSGKKRVSSEILGPVERLQKLVLTAGFFNMNNAKLPLKIPSNIVKGVLYNVRVSFNSEFRFLALQT